MRLIEQFKKDGDFLFRWRSYLPLIIVPFMVLVAFSFGSINTIMCLLLSR